MMSELKKLGEIIELVDKRNKSLETTEVLGITIDKDFMPSVANTIGTDLSKYQIIRKFDFACNPMHVGRDERLPVALYQKDVPALVSPAYFMFKIKDDKIVVPEYLMLVFRRKDFDRNCWFRTDGNVRGGIAWNDICDMKLPVPPLEEQQKIVDAYNAVENRIKIKQKINEKLEETAQAIYRKMFIEDADESWKTEKLCNISKMFAGGDKPDVFSELKNSTCCIPIYSNGLQNYGLYGFTDKAKVIEESVTVSARGTIGFPCLRLEPYFPIIRLISIIPNIKYVNALYLYYFLKNTNIVSSGTTQQQLTVPEFGETKIVIPNQEKIVVFEDKVRKLYLEIKNNEKEIEKLARLKQLLVSQIAKR